MAGHRRVHWRLQGLSVAANYFEIAEVFAINVALNFRYTYIQVS